MRTAISVVGLENWFAGDFAALVELVRLADRLGIDQVSMSDHVVMGEATDQYPYGPFPPGTCTYPWIEPLIQLGTFASVTTSIKLTTGIIIAPLRPAAVLAKQLATLDILSRGRIEIGLGVGWQKEEYEACGVSWDARYELMDEQVRVCKKLWSEAPASFHGKHVNFDKIYSLPFPPQGKNIPLYFGVAGTDRNIARIAEMGNGWLPMENEPSKLAAPIKKLKAAFAARGRGSERIEVRTTIAVARRSDGFGDLDATLARVPEYEEVGVNTLLFPIPLFCRGREDYAPFLERVVRVAEKTERGMSAGGKTLQSAVS